MGLSASPYYSLNVICNFESIVETMNHSKGNPNFKLERNSVFLNNEKYVKESPNIILNSII
jgi:hypothetical protein